MYVYLHITIYINIVFGDISRLGIRAFEYFKYKSFKMSCHTLSIIPSKDSYLKRAAIKTKYNPNCFPSCS